MTANSSSGKKTLHGRFFQDPRTREGKDKSSKIETKKKRKDKKSAASEPQRREDKRPGAAALANQRLSFERPCDQLISHAGLVIRPTSKSLSSIFYCTVLYCLAVQLLSFSTFHCMRTTRHAKTFDVLDHFPIGTHLVLAVAVLKFQRASLLVVLVFATVCRLEEAKIA